MIVPDLLPGVSGQTEAFGLLGIAILVGSFLISQLFRHRNQNATTPEFQAPTVEEGAVIPLITGIGEVAPNIRWFGDLEAKKRGDYVAYRGRMLYVLCLGPVDQLLDILFDDYAISSASYRQKPADRDQYGPTLNVSLPYARPISGEHLELFIQDEKLYGGPKEQGGPVGLIHLHWGTLDDVVCELTKLAFTQDRASAWPGVCYGTFGWIPDPPGDDLFDAVDWTESATHGGTFDYNGTQLIMQGLWSLGIGDGNGHLTTSRLFTGLDPDVVYTFSIKVKQTNGGTGGRDFFSLFASGGLSGDQHEDFDFDSGGTQTLVVSSRPSATGELTITIGETAIEFGDSVLQMTVLEAHWSGVSGLTEVYGGPYRTIDFFRYLNQPLPQDGKFEFCMNAPVPPGVRFLLQRLPVAVSGAGIGLDANPADMLWERYTDPLLGLGEPTALLDLASFQAGAEVFQAEQLGLSDNWNRQTPASDNIDQIKTHANCVVYVDPSTGKLKLQLIRADYDPDTLQEITRLNSWNIRVTRPEPDQLISEVQVKFRRFEPSWSQTETGYPLTPSLILDQQYELPASELITLSVMQGATGLVGGVDFYHADTVLVFPSTGGAIAGQPVTINYTTRPRVDGAVGFTNATQRAQNLATFQALGYNNIEVYDRPMFTRDSLAQREASRLCRVRSQRLAAVTWEMNREGSLLHEGAVVKLNSPLDEAKVLILRITKVTRGKGRDRSLKFEAVEDEFANDTPIYLPVSDGAGGDQTGSLKAPTPLGLVALDPSSIRLALYSANADFDFELKIADDEDETGAVIVAVDGAETTYDDPQTVGTTKSYWLRHVAPGYQPSDWIGPVTYTAVAGTVPDPDPFTAPTLSIAQSDDGTTGTATPTITNPLGMSFTVQVQTKAGDATASDLQEIEAPYVATVALVAGQESWIRYVLTYQDQDGNEQTIDLTVRWNAAEAPSDLSFTTVNDETATLPNSRRWSDGDGSTIDLSEPGKIKVNVTGGGGGGGGSLELVATATALLRTVGESVEIPIDDGWTIVEAEIQGNAAGNAVVDVLKATDAGFPAFASIAAAAKPTLAAQQRVVDGTLTGWTTALVAGDTLRFTLESSDLIEVTVALKLTRTATVNVAVPRIITLVRTLTVAGDIADLPIDADALILEAEIQADAAGSASVEVSRATDAGYPTFARLDGGVATALVAQQRVKDAALAGWTPNLSAGDTLRMRLATMGVGLTRVTFALKVQIGSGSGIGGFTGTVSTGAIPKAIGAQTLGDSGLTSDANAISNDRGWKPKTRTVSADDSALATDHTIVCRGELTLTLADAAANDGQELLVINDGADDVTLAGLGTDLVAVLGSEAATLVLSPGDTVSLLALVRDPTPNVWRAT